jgi:hypothetical protein
VVLAGRRCHTRATATTRRRSRCSVPEATSRRRRRFRRCLERLLVCGTLVWLSAARDERSCRRWAARQVCCNVAANGFAAVGEAPRAGTWARHSHECMCVRCGAPCCERPLCCGGQARLRPLVGVRQDVLRTVKRFPSAYGSLSSVSFVEISDRLMQEQQRTIGAEPCGGHERARRCGSVSRVNVVRRTCV